MNRCFLSWPAAVWALAGLLPLASPAQTLSTQETATGTAAGATAPTAARNFPQQAQRGELLVTAMPELTLNGKTVRTTPGFRLFNEQNQLVFAHNLVGKKYAVNYVIEPQTQWLHTAWILTAAEAAVKR